MKIVAFATVHIIEGHHKLKVSVTWAQIGFFRINFVSLCNSNILESLDEEIQRMIDTLPSDHRIVITSHDALQYFGQAYGLKFLAPQGLSTESEASAKQVEGLIKQIRK